MHHLLVKPHISAKKCIWWKNQKIRISSNYKLLDLLGEKFGVLHTHGRCVDRRCVALNKRFQMSRWDCNRRRDSRERTVQGL